MCPHSIISRVSCRNTDKMRTIARNPNGAGTSLRAIGLFVLLSHLILLPTLNADLSEPARVEDAQNESCLVRLDVSLQPSRTQSVTNKFFGWLFNWLKDDISGGKNKKTVTIENDSRKKSYPSASFLILLLHVYARLPVILINIYNTLYILYEE